MSDFLFLVCELAVAFAGFTAIVSVLDGRLGSGRQKLDVVRLRQMLELSLLTVAAGLFPALLGHLGIGEAAHWRIAAGTMGVAGIVMFPIQLRRGFTREIREAPGYSLAYARFLVVLGIAALVSFILAAFSVVPSPGGYALGVTLLLSVAGLQFFRASTSVLSLRAEARKG